jgi:putative phosphonate metabolism protein
VTTADTRYALYYAPDEATPLARFGSGWLGRDALADRPLERPPLPGFSAERIAEITTGPAHFGFHATLKAPFRLRTGATADDLVVAVERFADERPPFAAPPPVLGSLADFAAVLLSAPSAPFQALADDANVALEAFRAPPAEGELARRRLPGLTERQDMFVDRWGYAFVFEEWRFHMTLTDALDDAERLRLIGALAPLLQPLAATPLTVRSVCLFVEEGGRPLRLLRRFPFGRS